MTLVEERGELDFGLTLEPQKGIGIARGPSARAGSPSLRRIRRHGTPTLTRCCTRQGLPMVIRATTPGRLIVSRR